MEDLRYPVGQFDPTAPITADDRERMISEIEQTPGKMRAAIAGLNEQQLDTPYRPEGWTVRQVVHHVPDSHLNSYMRFKLALTEDAPLIRTYHEDRWATLPDSSAPVDVSLNLLDSLHRRWIILLRGLAENDFQRTFQHPEWESLNLDQALGMYAWHGRHHVAHITSLRDRMGW